VISTPGFTAEMSLYRSNERHHVVAKSADHVGRDTVIPQYCRCYALGTLQIGPTGAPEWGPPYQYYCYGPDCWHPKFGTRLK
jgi:hypothetical protein